ncbi:MAG: hypothetical protein KAX80_05520 [Planctomycetes bacterium]|nr:hypothetical protein [Planctomycetota bacterium]
MSTSKLSLPNTLADLRAAQTHVDAVIDSIDRLTSNRPDPRVLPCLNRAREEVLAAVGLLIDESWRRLWRTTADVRPPEDKP